MMMNSPSAAISRGDDVASMCERNTTTYGMLMNVPIQIIVAMLVLVVIVHDHMADAESKGWCQTLLVFYLVLSLIVLIVVYVLTSFEWKQCTDYINDSGWYPVLNYFYWFVIAVIIPVYFVQTAPLNKTETMSISATLIGLNMIIAIALSLHLRSYKNFKPTTSSHLMRYVLIGMIVLLLEVAVCGPYIINGPTEARIASAVVVGFTVVLTMLSMVFMLRRTSSMPKDLTNMLDRFHTCMRRREQSCLACAKDGKCE